MARIVERERAVPTTPASLEPRKTRPIVVWAVLGVIFLIIEVAAFIGWIGSGQATPTPTGPTPVPTYMKWFIHGWEIAGLLILPVFLYFFMIRPWRRERHITSDGLFCLVFATIYWQDTIANYFQPWFSYNSEFWNLGAINTHILGWMSPNGNLQAEPILWIVPFYIYAVFGGMVFGCWILRKIRAKRRQISNLGLLGACFGIFVVIDVFVELFWMRAGLMVLPGSIEWLTLFHGRFYQYPIYEGPLVAAWMTALISLRYFTNDKGETLPERALDKLRVKGKTKTLVRFLALAGAVNVGFLVYNIPGSIVGLYSSPWPQDIQQRSYFSYLCGPYGKDNYACPGPGIPITRQPDSAHVGVNGELVVPAGTKQTGPDR